MNDIKYIIFNSLFLKKNNYYKLIKKNIEENFKIEDNIEKIRMYIKILKSQPKN